MTEHPAPERSVSISQSLIVEQKDEPAIVITKRQYDRLIQRLDEATPNGWPELWLTGAGVGGGLAAAAIAGVFTLAPTSTARGVLWTLVALGIVATVACVAAFLSLRHNHRRDMADLKRDLKMYTDS